MERSGSRRDQPRELTESRNELVAMMLFASVPGLVTPWVKRGRVNEMKARYLPSDNVATGVGVHYQSTTGSATLR